MNVSQPPVESSSSAWCSTPSLTKPLPEQSSWVWVLLGAGAVVMAFMYADSLGYMARIWMEDDNYGHGFFVPVLSLALAWRLRARIDAVGQQYSWWGIPLVVLGGILYWVGELSTLYVLLHLSAWCMLVGLSIAAFGPKVARVVAFPLVYLLTMIPLPQFLSQGLAAQLQLLSSALGVGCLQLVGVTAFREGNVIDLGPIQLQVVEACSGLRYLIPLLALVLLCAYLFKAAFWKRVFLVLSSIPIAIALNGVRIGLIGVLVEHFGQGAAEGFAHFIEGWMLFVASLALVLSEMWVLARVGRDGRAQSWSDLLAWETSAPASTSTHLGLVREASPSDSAAPLLCSVALLIPVWLMVGQIAGQTDAAPPRHSFFEFPMSLREWTGSSLVMEQTYQDVLRFDDYILADYRRPGGPPVNAYVAYYHSQQKGQSAHSPKTCLPGGGWEIVSLEEREAPGMTASSVPLRVNRALIQKGEQQQVVWYWFQQRGRVLTNEYFVKWFLLWDAVTRHRTDGALVRLTSLVEPGESVEATDRRVEELATMVYERLPEYVPN